MEAIKFNVQNLINVVHNEPVIWNATLNASEEDEEIAWRRIASCFGFNTCK